MLTIRYTFQQEQYRDILGGDTEVTLKRNPKTDVLAGARLLHAHAILP